MKVLYAGDGHVGSVANYMLGVLKYLKTNITHVPPSEKLGLGVLRNRFNAFILSDFPADHMPRHAQEAIVGQLAHGSGLLMVGGWASFSGPYGNWRGSIIEKSLPVTCKKRDDRLQYSSGAVIIPKMSHTMFGSLPFTNPPLICGLNDVAPKEGSLVLLGARRIICHGAGPSSSLKLRLDATERPLLVIDPNPSKRLAALSTDLAPHWCAGLVDWGTRRKTLPITNGLSVEVGHLYLQFVSSIIRWLLRA